MSENPSPAAPGQPGQISLSGGAAIVAPPSAFPNGIPSNALIVIPLGANGAPVEKKIADGPVALTQDEMWKLLGFNGPAVQVQDDQGRPVAIGLEDLLAGLEKHWKDDDEDPNRGRIFAQELMKYGKFDRAEKVLATMVAQGGDGEDWLALGVCQLNLKKLDKAESTLNGASNLLKGNPFPAMHLARVAHERGDKDAEKEAVLRAIQIDPNAVDAWAYYTNFMRDSLGDEDKAVSAVIELAETPVNAKSAAPFVALQGFFANEEETRDKAIDFAKKAVSRSSEDPLALLCLSALYGQSGKLDEVVKLLAPHEGKMVRDVQLAHNYFEALVRLGDMPTITKLLNKLATSPDARVKQFAIERSRAVAQMMQQQKQAAQSAPA